MDGALLFIYLSKKFKPFYMTKSSIKSQFIPKENKIEIKPELKNTILNLPPNQQTYKKKLLSINGFIINN